MGKRGPGSHVTWPEEATQSTAKRSRLLGPGLFQGADGSTGGRHKQKARGGRPEATKGKRTVCQGNLSQPGQRSESRVGWQVSDAAEVRQGTPRERNAALDKPGPKKAGRARHHPLTAGSAQQKPGGGGGGHTPQQPGSQVTWDEAGQTEVKWGTSSLSCASPGSWGEGLPWWLRR